MSPDEVAVRRAKARPADLESAAASLYALTPHEFTATRNERAKTVNKSDTVLGQRIRRLPKPSSAAWLINMLVRHRREDLEILLELGVALRRAQADFDHQELKALGHQRSAVLATVAKEARSLAEELEHPVSEPVLTDVEQTLRAAMTDADAAEAVASGLLLRVLEASGWETVDLAGAVAVPEVLEGGIQRAKRAPEISRRETKRREKDDNDVRQRDADPTPEPDPGDADHITTEGDTNQRSKSSRASPRAQPAKEDHSAEPAAHSRTTAAEKKIAREAQRETRRRDRQAQTKAATELEQAEHRARKTGTETERAANKLEDLASRREQLTTELDDLRTKIRELEGEVAEIKQEEGDAKAALRSAERAASQARAEVEQTRKQLEGLS